MWPSNSNDDDNNNSKFPFLNGIDNTSDRLNKLSSWLGSAIQSDRDFRVPTITDIVDHFTPADEAFPVPTATKYTNCIDNGGRSIWTEDGFWRCVLSGAQPPEHLKTFTDYTSFLEYQRDVLKRKRAEEESRSKQILPRSEPNFGFDGFDYTRLISEEEAKGKRCVSRSDQSQTVTLDNGDIETRTQTIRRFDDGTALIQSSKDTAPNKGWFW